MRRTAKIKDMGEGMAREWTRVRAPSSAGLGPVV